MSLLKSLVLIGGAISQLPAGDTVGDWNTLANKPATFPPAAHSHVIADVTNLQTTLDGKVLKAGDTMTGDLAISKATPQFTLNSPAVDFKTIYFDVGGLHRWHIRTDAAPETGANAGSDLSIHRYGDTGSTNGIAFHIQRSDGRVTIADGSGISNLNASNIASGTLAAARIADASLSIAKTSGLQAALDGKAASVHTHAIADVTGLQTALNGKAPLVHTHAISEVTGLQTALDAKLASSAYTAADVLAKLLTVDGAGSGLDADLLDGNSSAFYATAAADALKMPLAGGTFTGAVTFNVSPIVPSLTNGDNSTKAANTAYVDAAIGQAFEANDAMVFKGTINASANPNYPAANAGHVYRISAAGKIGGAAGPNVEIGDTLYCLVDNSLAGTHATVGANWQIVQSNIDGAVIGPAAAVDNAPALFSGTTGKLIKETTYAAFKVSLAIAAADVSGLGYFATGTDAANLSGTLAAARIADNSLPVAKHNFTATSRILGRVTAGAGVGEELTGAQVLSITGALPASSYTAADVLAKLLTVDTDTSGLNADTLDGQQGSYYLALANHTGLLPLASITAGADNTLLRMNGTTVMWGLLNNNMIADNQIQLPKLFQQAANTLVGNATAGIASPTALTAAQAKTLLAIAIADVSGLQTSLNAKADLAGDTFTGAVQFPNGTAALPSVAVGEATSGLFLKGAGNLGVALAGVEAMDFSVSGAAYLGTIRGGANTQLGANAYSNDTFAGIIAARKARGTVAVPANLIQNDLIGSFNALGYADGGFRQGGGLRFQAIAATPSSTNMEARWLLEVPAAGSVTSTEGLRYDHATGLTVAQKVTAQGLAFPATQVASADPNTLDDYEEGTYTPVFSSAPTPPTGVTYSVQQGAYTRIGRLVMVTTCRIVLTSKGTGGVGTISLSLPFTAASPIAVSTNGRFGAATLPASGSTLFFITGNVAMNGQSSNNTTGQTDVPWSAVLDTFNVITSIAYYV